MKNAAGRLRADALRIFRASLDAADAGKAVRSHLTKDGEVLRAGRTRIALGRVERVFLVAAGKAAPQMALAVEKVLGKRLTGGLVITKHGHGTRLPRRLTTLEAGHPIPDQAGVEGSGAVATLLSQLTARDLLIVALSGGASAILCAPAEPISLADKQQTTDLLLRAGADIFELNCVRKHLSFLKGGQLAALAQPARVLSLLLSDVVGDPMEVIGSGPTAPDPSTFGEALSVLEAKGILGNVPDAVRRRLESGQRGEIAETPKAGDPLFRRVTNLVIGSNRLALEAASQKAKELGYRTIILSSRMQGEAKDTARLHAGILQEASISGHPARPPVCILSGGETTVTVRGRGKGGRNQEFALAMAMELAGWPNLTALSAGTDGTDGPTDAAGAIVNGETMARADAAGLDAARYLTNNDSYSFFEQLGDLVKTGPTGTNVMDINVMLCGKAVSD